MKKIINKLIDIFSNVFSKYLITIISIYILTLITRIFMNNVDDTIINICIGLIIFSSSSFIIESLDKKRYLLYIPITIISIVLPILRGISSIYIDRFIITYVIVNFIYGIYYSYKKSNIDLSKYIINTLINTFKMFFVYGILIFGTVLILSIFSSLIYEFDVFDALCRFLILLSGFYLTPTFLYSINENNFEPYKFVKVIIRNILQIIMIISFLIVYLYIFKIFLTLDMPSNEVFRIIAILFIVGLPIWTMASYFKEEKKLDKINSILPYLFMPFILLEIYALGIRIISNGFTPTRYMGVMLIIIEIIYSILYIIKKIDKIFIVTIILIIISSIIPYINMFDVSINSQLNNLMIYKNKSNLTDKDKDMIYGAYYYLLYEDEDIINKNLTKEDINTILAFKNNTYNYYEQANFEVSEIDIKGYSKMSRVGMTNTYPLNLHNVKINNNTIDIYDLVMNSIRDEDYFNTNNKFDIEDGKIVIRKLDIGYYKSDMSISYIDVEAYLLKK